MHSTNNDETQICDREGLRMSLLLSSRSSPRTRLFKMAEKKSLDLTVCACAN